MGDMKDIERRVDGLRNSSKRADARMALVKEINDALASNLLSITCRTAGGQDWALRLNPTLHDKVTKALRDEKEGILEEIEKILDEGA